MAEARVLTREELLEALQDEVEAIKAIYADYEVVVQEPELTDESPEITEAASLILDIKPAIGIDHDKNGLLAHCRFEFALTYPFTAPVLTFTVRKGLEQEQFQELKDKLNKQFTQMAQEKLESEDEYGMLFEIFELVREKLTQYNDTVAGNCPICMLMFRKPPDPTQHDQEEEERTQKALSVVCNHQKGLKVKGVNIVESDLKGQLQSLSSDDKDGEEDSEQKFTDRADLVRIDKCFHRFHLVCLHRYWYMPRVSEKDSFGDQIDYKLPEEKSCPVCRRVVEAAEQDHVKQVYLANPSIEDNSYWQEK